MFLQRSRLKATACLSSPKPAIQQESHLYVRGNTSSRLDARECASGSFKWWYVREDEDMPAARGSCLKRARQVVAKCYPESSRMVRKCPCCSTDRRTSQVWLFQPTTEVRWIDLHGFVIICSIDSSPEHETVCGHDRHYINNA